MNLAALKEFKSIDLEVMNQVKLMKRVDLKFLLPINAVPEIFKTICNDYYILEINNQRLHGYHTVYFDTSDNKLYKCHHNGKLNRYKIRKRIYMETNTSFLEVKFKNNKGKTIKERVVTNDNLFGLTQDEHDYINARIPFDANMLIPKISNKFHRITLANKNFNERCTVDFDIDFLANGMLQGFKELVIIEVKQDGGKAASPLIHVLKNLRIKPTGFSKYCMGRVLTDDSVKQNAFKAKLRTVNKITSK